MSIKEDWNRIVSEIKANYPERKITVEDDRIEVDFDPSTFLTVKKEGLVEGSMPQHHFESRKVNSLEVKDGITKVRGDNFEYLFKE